MNLDARALSSDAELETDLCIVGAGPAGISLASEFIGSSLDVLVLESGGPRAEHTLQDLNAGSIEGDRYADLHTTRHRQYGGTANIWNTPVGGHVGAKFTPLDATDFDEHDVPLSGWPLRYSDLEPYYRRAQTFCGLGPLAYEAEHWHEERGRRPLALDHHLVNQVYQFGTNHPFTATYVHALQMARNIRLCHHATVRRLEADRGRRRILSAQAASRSGNTVRIRARVFVLAAGAIENARLLLLSGDALALCEGREWVGRCFMEHPRDFGVSLIPHSSTVFEQAAFYDLHRSPSGVLIGGRIALSRDARVVDRLPNTSLTLLPRSATPVARAGGFGWVVDRLRWIGRPAVPSGYGWSRLPDPLRWFDAFRVILNVEQHPHPDNQIVLGTDRDALNLPRPVLRWRWRSSEQAGLERVRESLARWLQQLGRVEVRRDLEIDPNAHHHAGTTRMQAASTLGVVDATCRAHGVDNLYVAGASVFPTCGCANPTLTIVALGLRLAEHLKRSL